MDHTYHFFSGIGRGTAFTRQGKFGWPDRFLPRIVPTRFSGRMTKKQIQQTATCRKDKQKLLRFTWVVCVYRQHPEYFQIPHHLSQSSQLCPCDVFLSAQQHLIVRYSDQVMSHLIPRYSLFVLIA